MVKVPRRRTHDRERMREATAKESLTLSMFTLFVLAEFSFGLSSQRLREWSVKPQNRNGDLCGFMALEDKIAHTPCSWHSSSRFKTGRHF